MRALISAAKLAGAPALVDDHGAVGAADRLERSVAIVERAQGAQVDDLGVDAVRGELLGGGEGASASVPP